jgi:hypothetical protein
LKPCKPHHFTANTKNTPEFELLISRSSRE